MFVFVPHDRAALFVGGIPALLDYANRCLLLHKQLNPVTILHLQ